MGVGVVACNRLDAFLFGLIMIVDSAITPCFCVKKTRGVTCTSFKLSWHSLAYPLTRSLNKRACSCAYLQNGWASFFFLTTAGRKLRRQSTRPLSRFHVHASRFTSIPHAFFIPAYILYLCHGFILTCEILSDYCLLVLLTLPPGTGCAGRLSVAHS